MAGINEGFIFFNDIISAILAQEIYIKRSPIRGPRLTNYRSKTTIAIIDHYPNYGKTT
jgi:hypothetical protein